MQKNAIVRIVIAALVMLTIFSAGVLTSHYEQMPATLYKQAIMAYQAMKHRNRISKEIENKDLSVSHAHISKQYGKVHIQDKKNAYSGYTMICKEDAQPLLVDMDGVVRHTWDTRFYKLWPKPKHITNPIAEKAINCSTAHLYPNGDLMVLLHGFGDTPYGYGVAKIDKQSQLLWTYDKHAHHDFYVAHDAKIYVLTHDFQEKPINGLEFYSYPILTDTIAILSPEGKELEQINLLAAFLETPFQSILQKANQQRLDDNHGKKMYDVLHTNSVMVLEPDIASAFAIFSPNDILISMRELNSIAVIDAQTHKIKWYMHGPWFHQHQAVFIKDGSIMLFDNRGIWKQTGEKQSRIITIDPNTQKITHQYRGNEPFTFFSYIKGSARMLPNNNILINHTDQYAITEIDAQERRVWHYEINTRILDAKRYSPIYFDTDFCKTIGCFNSQSAE